MLFSRSLQERQCRAQRQTQIGAGITVRDRKHIDVVQEFLFADDTMNSGNERTGERVTIERPCYQTGQMRRYSRGSRKVTF